MGGQGAAGPRVALLRRGRAFSFPSPERPHAGAPQGPFSYVEVFRPLRRLLRCDHSFTLVITFLCLISCTALSSFTLVAVG